MTTTIMMDGCLIIKKTILVYQTYVFQRFNVEPTKNHEKQDGKADEGCLVGFEGPADFRGWEVGGACLEE